MTEPRLTAFWEKQGAKVKAALLPLGDDEEFHRVLMGSVGFSVMSERLHAAQVAKAVAMEAEGAIGDAALQRRWVAEREAATRRAAQDILLPLVVKAALGASPRLGHVLGEHRLREFLSGLIAAGAMLVLRGEDAALQVFERLAPATFWHLVGNPLTLLSSDGSLVAGETEDPRHYQQVVAYKRSLRPAGKPGRPRGQPKPKGTPRPRITDEAIADTGSMRVAEWAAKHAPDLDLSDPRQSKAAYAKFDRASYHRRNREA